MNSFPKIFHDWMKWVDQKILTKKTTLFLVLLTIALSSICGALNIYSYFGANISKSMAEIAKMLMNLGAGVIIGGLVKILLDDFRAENERKNKIRDIKKDILNRLRSVFDQIELSRTLIQSHKSARTYSNRIQQAVMPSVITLFDIKRSLVDSEGMMADKKLEYFRVSIHYMIAYLTTLINEYQEKYPNISQKQLYQEAIKTSLKNDYAAKVKKKIVGVDVGTEIKELNEEDIYELVGERIPDVVQLVWKDLSGLDELSKFLKGGSSIYMDVFVDHYEYCKHLLQRDDELEEKYLPDTFEGKYVKKLKQNDKGKSEGNKPSINLVNLIIDEIIQPTS